MSLFLIITSWTLNLGSNIFFPNKTGTFLFSWKTSLRLYGGEQQPKTTQSRRQPTTAHLWALANNKCLAEPSEQLPYCLPSCQTHLFRVFHNSLVLKPQGKGSQRPWFMWHTLMTVHTQEGRVHRIHTWKQKRDSLSSLGAALLYLPSV